MDRVGLIAGSGRFPVLFAETARRHGVEVCAVAHRGETDPELERVVARIAWVYPGEIGGIIDALKAAGVTKTVMVGGIAKPRLFRELRPDARALAILARLGPLGDDRVLRAVAAELESEGIAVVESTLFLSEIVPAAGVWCSANRRHPTLGSARPSRRPALCRAYSGRSPSEAAPTSMVGSGARPTSTWRQSTAARACSASLRQARSAPCAR